MPSLLHKRREILRAFYGLIGILAVSFTLVTIAVLVWQSEERTLRARLEQFHLRIVMLTSEASRHASALQLELATLSRRMAGTPDAAEELDIARTTRPRVFSIGQVVESMVDVSGPWRQPADPTADVIDRAARQYRELSDGIRRDPLTTADLFEKVEALNFTLFQIERLHAIAAEELLGRIDATTRRTTRRAVLLTALVLVVAGLIVTRILWLLRTRLQEHERTAQALLERERQLRQSSKMEALGALVGGIAHDFNNLLTAMLGYTELLLGQTDRAAPGQRTLHEIRKAGERAAHLTRQLLVFSRQQPVERQVVDVSLMLRDLEPMLRRLIRADITLRVDPGTDTANVRADRVQLEQVLVNLAVNARDAMDGGGVLTVGVSNVRVDAAHRAVTSPGDYVRIRVEDTGRGMSPETSARVFEPFFTTKERGKGTGLGLATVHGIVTGAGGRVSVESEVGRGTRFDVYLPRCQEDAIEPETDREQDGEYDGSETVLVAEDEPQILEVVVSALRGAGYHVLEARDGNEALRVCAEFPGQVQLIVSDLIMPGMRGPEMVQQALKRQPQAGVLFISGYAEDELLEDDSVAGVPLLAKPFRLQQLLKLVRQELDLAHIRDGAASHAAMPSERAGASRLDR